jgi:hypothetical protein
MSVKTITEDCTACDFIGLVSPAWDILPPCGEAPTLVRCPSCDGTLKVTRKIKSE